TSSPRGSCYRTTSTTAVLKPPRCRSRSRTKSRTLRRREMSCLIVGCGYLGRRVGAILSARQEKVYGTTRSEERASTLKPLGIIPVVADVLEPNSLITLPKVDRVFYCVGFDRSTGTPLRV